MQDTVLNHHTESFLPYLSDTGGGCSDVVKSPSSILRTQLDRVLEPALADPMLSRDLGVVLCRDAF